MKTKLMTMLLVAGAMIGAWAEELTVHDGIATNNRIPFDVRLTHQKFLLPADAG